VLVAALAAAVATVLMLDVAYFLRGSLETFPTAEQQQKVQLVTGVIAVVLAAVEFGLWRLARWMLRPRSA
jgi:hypothetical protein